MLAYALAFNPRSKATDIEALLSLRAVSWLDLAGLNTVIMEDLRVETEEIGLFERCC